MSRPSKSQPSQAAMPDFHCAGVSSERRVASSAGDIGRGLYALQPSDARDLDLARVEPHVEPARAYAGVSDRKLDPVASGRLWSEPVGPEGPGASGAARDLLDGREAQVRIEANAQGARQGPAAPEGADHAIRDLAVAAAELLDPHWKRRRIDRGRLKIPGQGRPLRTAPLLDQQAVARARGLLMGPPGVLPHMIGGGGLVVDQDDLVHPLDRRAGV